MATKRQTRPSNGALIPNCPHCKEWASETRGRISRFRMADGSIHAAPEMWLMGRAQRREAEGYKPLEAHMIAMGDWTEQCDLRARVEAPTRTIRTLSPVAETLMARHIAKLKAA